jgi:mannose-6-phosphate isomerase-like protein (cupin superfamily)
MLAADQVARAAAATIGHILERTNRIDGHRAAPPHRRIVPQDSSLPIGATTIAVQSGDTEQPIDLHAIIDRTEGQGALWAHVGDDLNVNLLVWPLGGGVKEHVNAEVEVLLVGMEGAGIVLIDDQPSELRPGSVLVVPKGSRRAIESRSVRFAYLSVHRRRAGLMPTRRSGSR